LNNREEKERGQMDNGMQTEVREITLDELRKITWDYSENTIVGCHQNNVLRIYLFEVANLRAIHPLTVQRCNVAEGWIEHIVCESYPKVDNSAEFFNLAKIVRDENGDIQRVKVYQEVIVNLQDVSGNTLLTLGR